MSNPVSSTGARAGTDPLAALRDGRIQGGEARLKAATRLLEGTFYQELFKAMRETVPEGGALSGGSGQEMFESMMDQHVADSAAASSHGGVGEALYRYFTSAPSTDDVVPPETEA